MGLIKYNRNYEKYAESAPIQKNSSLSNPDITIGCLLKDSTIQNLKYECKLISINSQNYSSALEENTIDFILAQYTSFTDDKENTDRFSDFRKSCKSKKIPLVFWEMGEPFEFDNLKYFDYIFTIFKEKVEEYKFILKTNQIYYLPFGVQQRIYHPIERSILNKEEAFKERKSIQLDKVMGTTYKIYSLISKEEAFVPKEIFELLSMGGVLISPNSRLIKDLFSEQILFYQNDVEMLRMLSPLLKEKDQVDKISFLNHRNILNNHTYTHRIDQILKTIGLPINPNKYPGVSMLSATNKLDSMENIFNNYQNQNYPNKELIVVLNNNKLDLEEWKNASAQYKNVKIFQVDESKPLGRCLNLAIENSDFPYFSKCDDDNYYAPNFLTDLMAAFRYADAQIIGKLSYYCYLEGCNTLAIMCPNMEYRYVNMLSGSALIIKREVFDKVKFRDNRAGSDTVFLKECISQGISMFSADRYNYVYKRHKLQETHTWKMRDEVLLKSCKVIDILNDYQPIVTV